MVKAEWQAGVNQTGFSTYQSQLELPIHQQLDAYELIGHLTQSEFLTRTNERVANYIKMAKPRLLAIPEHVECSVERNLRKEQLTTLHILGAHIFVKIEDVTKEIAQDLVKEAQNICSYSKATHCNIETIYEVP